MTKPRMFMFLDFVMTRAGIDNITLPKLEDVEYDGWKLSFTVEEAALSVKELIESAIPKTGRVLRS